MAITLAFDVYGTLIDTQAVAEKLREYVGSQADEFAANWRQKQLEYSFRKGLMGKYEDFSICTKQSLDYTCESMQLALSKDDRQSLLQEYSSLPAFEDVKKTLAELKQHKVRVFAFSNGLREQLEPLLQQANILHLFEGVVSVHDVQSFKPDPKVYKHFLKQTLSTKNETWLVSSNSFDVYGALSEGWKAVWLNRDSKGHLDPWGKQPTAEIENLRELSHLCLEAGSSEKAKDQSILYYGGLPFSLNERG